VLALIADPHQRRRPALRVRNSVARVIQTVRRGALWAHLALALLVVAGVFAQVYLIGAYIFGAGSEALDAHRTVGFIVHGFEVLILVAALVAWLPRSDVVLSLLLAAGGIVQLALSGAASWTGALHPLGALFVLTLAAALVPRDLRHVGRTPVAPLTSQRHARRG
jgi:hypothetical protein